MKAMLAVLFAVMLTGCFGTFQRQPQERIVYKFIRVPVEMTEKVVVSAPPEPSYYSKLSWDQQEPLLMGLIQSHTKTIGVCNARLNGIGEWSNKQLQIYEPANP